MYQVARVTNHKIVALKDIDTGEVIKVKDHPLLNTAFVLPEIVATLEAPDDDCMAICTGFTAEGITIDIDGEHSGQISLSEVWIAGPEAIISLGL